MKNSDGRPYILSRTVIVRTDGYEMKKTLLVKEPGTLYTFRSFDVMSGFSQPGTCKDRRISSSWERKFGDLCFLDDK
jgi:hypothetical protein